MAIRSNMKFVPGTILKLVLLILLFLHGQVVAAGLSKNGTDPTEPRTRIDINIAEAQFIASGDIFGTILNGDIAFTDWVSIGIGIPYYYAVLPSTKVSGIGDINIGFLIRLIAKQNKSGFASFAIGTDFSLNSGDSQNGTGLGQYVSSPYLIAAFYLGEDFLVAPIIQQYYSFGGIMEDPTLNEMSIRVRNTLSTEGGHWFTLTPEIIIDFNGVYRTRYLLRSTLGYMINEHWAISGDFVTHLYGDQRFESIGRLNLRYLFEPAILN